MLYLQSEFSRKTILRIFLRKSEFSRKIFLRIFVRKLYLGSQTNSAWSLIKLVVLLRSLFSGRANFPGNKILRNFLRKLYFGFQTHSDWSLIKLVALLRSLFQPYSCDGVVHSTNEPQVLLANVSAGSEAISFGSACLLEGEYAFRLEIPLGSGSLGSQSEITVDSVSGPVFYLNSLSCLLDTVWAVQGEFTGTSN